MNGLKSARGEREKTIDQMAAVAGVDKKTYMNWEAGKTKPNAEHLILMADHLKVDIDYLCRGVAGPCHFLSHLECITIPEAQEICEVYDLLYWKDRAKTTTELNELRLIAWAIRREKDAKRINGAME